MKGLSLLLFLFLPTLMFSQEDVWVKTEGEVMEINFHRSKRLMKASGIVRFTLENGEDIESNVELVRIPLYGCLNAVGDKISIQYNQQNPGLVQTPFGHFLFNYGMYILVFLGIIFSIRPFLKMRKKGNAIE